MNGPRIQSDERGITINKSLAWTMGVALVLGGLWIGNETAGTKAVLINIEKVQQQQREDINEIRPRLRTLETARATDGNEISALRRELTTFREDVRELNTLLQQLQNSLTKADR